MSRIVLWATVALLLGHGGRAGADFILQTDPASFVYNDVGPWVRTASDSAGPYPTTNGLGTFAFHFSTVSVPSNQSLVSTPAGGLFVGVTSAGTGQAASYGVDAQFDFGPAAVLGFGFYLNQLSPATVLRVFDGSGREADFTLDPSGGYLRPNPGLPAATFVSVSSDVPILGFRLSESVQNGTAELGVSEVFVSVAVPAPPGIVAAVVGLGCVCARGRRGRNTAV